MTTPANRRRYGPSRGTNLERAVVHDLEDNGYRTMRAAASQGSIKADVIGIKPGQMLLVQCKRHPPSHKAKGWVVHVPPAEWNLLYQAATWIPGALAIIATGTPTKIEYFVIIGVKRPGSRITPWREFALDLAAPGHRRPAAGDGSEWLATRLLDRLDYPIDRPAEEGRQD